VIRVRDEEVIRVQGSGFRKKRRQVLSFSLNPEP
jgi:hypothetical protein